MRYYALTLINSTGQVIIPDPTGQGFISSGAGAGTTFSSLDHNGVNIPGALNIEFDFPVVTYDAFQGGQIIRIWGVGIGMIAQASDLNGANFILEAGMAVGLPLATAAAQDKQAGIIAQGQIFQAFGNWKGVEQTLDLICNPGGIFPTNGIPFTWEPGTPLASQIFTTLTQAFPAPYQVNVNISADLQPPNGATQYGGYTSLQAFSSWLTQVTRPIGRQITNNSAYPGVTISTDGSSITVSDSQTLPAGTGVIKLQFQDLIGQPTWLAINQITFKTVLRADITMAAQVMFPPGILPGYVLTSPGAAAPGAPARNKTIFQGTFTIMEIHHYANLRQVDAESWNTTFVAFPTNS